MPASAEKSTRYSDKYPSNASFLWPPSFALFPLTLFLPHPSHLSSLNLLASSSMHGLHTGHPPAPFIDSSLGMSVRPSRICVPPSVPFYAAPLNPLMASFLILIFGSEDAVCYNRLVIRPCGVELDTVQAHDVSERKKFIQKGFCAIAKV